MPDCTQTVAFWVRSSFLRIDFRQGKAETASKASALRGFPTQYWRKYALKNRIVFDSRQLNPYKTDKKHERGKNMDTKKTVINSLLGGISAGILISIGGSVYLACDNKYVGAVLFSVALLCICIKGYYLFTGKVGYMVESHKKSDFIALISGLAGNAIATAVCGIAVRYAIPTSAQVAEKICEAKLGQATPQTLIRAIFCGVLMYLAVSIYKEKSTVAGIVFCVPVFILSGFEHSIANMFYFSAASDFSLQAAVYLAVVVIGNSIGGILLPLIKKAEIEELNF